jgi:hypothetical protein
MGYRKNKSGDEKDYDHHRNQKYALDHDMPLEGEAYKEDTMQGYHWNPKRRCAHWNQGRIEMESESSDSDTDLDDPDYQRASFPWDIQWERRHGASARNDSQKIRA